MCNHISRHAISQVVVILLRIIRTKQLASKLTYLNAENNPLPASKPAGAIIPKVIPINNALVISAVIVM